MESIEARGVTQGVIRIERAGPTIDRLGLPSRPQLRLERGGIKTIKGLKAAIREDLLPSGIGPDSIQEIQRALGRYAKRERKRR